MDNEAGAIAVPLSLFGGESLQLSPPDVPEGVSPGCFDVAFVPGSAFSRPGLNSIITNIFQTPYPIVYTKTYTQPNGNPLTLMFDSNGSLWSENVLIPGIRSQMSVGLNVPAQYMQSVSAFGREYFATSDGLHGLGVPLQWDGTFSGGNANLDRVTQDGPAAAVTVADSASAGTVSAGQHQCVVMNLTRNGGITAPSPVATWTAAGSKKVTISNIPIGPWNVVARILAFTGAGGDNFFYIPTQISLPNPGAPPTLVASTVINDNTTSTVTMDFSDNALFGATAIDIPGRNLFAQVVLGPVLGFFSYANRLVAYGEANKVQNFLNMGFEGGYLASAPTVPLGWTTPTAGGSLGNGGGAWPGGAAYVITGDGTANPRGVISQPAYQDLNGQPIILPNTSYTFRAWVQGGSSGGSVLVAVFFSPSLGFINSVVLPVDPTALGANTNRYIQGNMGTTPAVIPADMLFRIYAVNLQNGTALLVDELSLIYTQNPWNPNFRISYVNNPEGFDGVTGVLGPAGDQSGIQVAYEQQDVMYFHTLAGMYYTRDSGNSEPATWSVQEKSRKVGALCFRAADAGEIGVGTSAEDFAFIASRSGLYVFSGGEPLKISQEQQPRWDRINWSAVRSLWLKNDTSSRRVHIGLPLDQDTSPTLVLTMDYKELNTASAVEASGPIRISFSGKMIASDMTRKWSPWALPMTCGEILMRPANTSRFCMGGSFANIYYLDPLKLTDDDYGTLTPYYITYGFLNHEMEQQLGVGSHRKLYCYLTQFVSGVGQIQITPLAASLTNAWNPLPIYSLEANPDSDLEWGVNVTAERCFFKIQSLPLPGQTDNSFNLQKMVVSVRPDPWSLVGGAL